MPLRFLAYGWGAVGDSRDRVETPWSTQSEFLSEFLPRQKFDAVPFLGVAKSLDELIEAYDASEIARPTMPYEIDGVVYKVNDGVFKKLSAPTQDNLAGPSRTNSPR